MEGNFLNFVPAAMATLLPDVVRIISQWGYLVADSFLTTFENIHQFRINSPIVKEREIDLITLRVVDYPGLKELRYVEEKTEHDDRHNVDSDTIWNTFCVSEVSVGIWMTHGAVPRISKRKEIVVI